MKCQDLAQIIFRYRFESLGGIQKEGQSTRPQYRTQLLRELKSSQTSTLAIDLVLIDEAIGATRS